MKKLFLAFLVALPLSVAAQTNIQIRTTVDGVNSTINLDSTGSKKDTNRMAGINYAYGVYTNSLATNAVPLAKQVWLRDKFITLVDDYSSQKQAVDNSVIAEKLRLLLTINTDLLSSAQLNTLQSIAALQP